MYRFLSSLSFVIRIHKSFNVIVLISLLYFQDVNGLREVDYRGIYLGAAILFRR